MMIALPDPGLSHTTEIRPEIAKEASWFCVA
jgi:hypothetical protein